MVQEKEIEIKERKASQSGTSVLGEKQELDAGPRGEEPRELWFIFPQV